MKTVAIISQKGGTGKTTMALHLAVAAERAGKAAVVLDLDPQASAAGWKDSRADETPTVATVPHTRLEVTIKAAKENGADLVILDSAPHSDQVAMAAARAADLVLIPCRPGVLDIRAIGASASIAQIAKVAAFAVINAVPPRAASLVEDARAAVGEHKLQVAPVVLHQRAAYAHALIDGRVAMEYEPDGKAAEEASALYTWLAKLLKI